MGKKHRDQIWEKEESNWKFRNYEREIFLQLVLEQEGKILELGPGYGRVMRRVAENNIEITGLDMSESLANKLKEKGFNAICGNAENMPFEDETISCVIAEEVIEHIEEQSMVISETYRVLKKDGYAIYSTPNKWIYRLLMYLSNIINWKWSWSLVLNPTPGHISELTIRKAKKLFSNYFTDVTIIPLNPYLPNKTISKFQFLSIGYIIIAVKK